MLFNDNNCMFKSELCSIATTIKYAIAKLTLKWIRCKTCSVQTNLSLVCYFF